MHPRIQELLLFLADQRRALTEAVALIPPGQLSARPGDGGWSTAEVMEHLSIVERRIAVSFAQALKTARHNGLPAESETSSVMGMLDLVQLGDRSRKLTAGEASQPKGVQTVDESWAALADARRSFQDTLQAASGLALEEVTFPHPRFGPLNGYQWALFVGAHEARHASQILEVAAALRARETVL